MIRLLLTVITIIQYPTEKTWNIEIVKDKCEKMIKSHQILRPTFAFTVFYPDLVRYILFKMINHATVGKAGYFFCEILPV